MHTNSLAPKASQLQTKKEKRRVKEQGPRQKETSRAIMFWRVQGEEQASPVEKLLDRDDFTLEDLLLEEDVIQEVSSTAEAMTSVGVFSYHGK